MSGASGSPVLDEQGQVVGVTSGAFHNLLFAIKVDHLQALIHWEIGTNCILSLSVIIDGSIKGCIKEEIENLERLANEGSMYAQYRLGRKHNDEDKWVDSDINEAIFLYRESAEQGYAPAQSALGARYRDTGISSYINEAIKWFEKAAEQGFILSQGSLAIIYREGKGEIERNPGKAFQLYRQAAEKGYVLAQFLLGDLYERGDGVGLDITEAVKWYKKAAEQGYFIAQIDLGDMYYSGETLDQDFEQAFY